MHVVRGKRHRVEGLELPSGEVMKDVDQDGYKYLGVLQTDVMMTKEMKKKVRDEYFRRLKLLLKSQLYAGNLIAKINAWAIGIVRYTAGVLEWTKKELKQIPERDELLNGMSVTGGSGSARIRRHVKSNL